MKKIFALLLTLALTLTLVGCKEAKGEGVKDHAQFVEVEDKEENVSIEAYIQAKTYKNSWNNVSLYLQDKEGGYYVYRMPVTEAQYDELKIGQKIKITGTKAVWGGMHEFAEGTAKYELERGEYIAKAKDVTKTWSNLDEMIKSQGMLVKFTGAKVVATKVDGADKPFAYKWNGSGQKGDDLYFNLQIGEVTYQFLVETDLCNAETDVYKAGEALKLGDTVTVEGFLFWYEGKPNMHVTKISK